MPEMSKQRRGGSLCPFLLLLGATTIFGKQPSPSQISQAETQGELQIVIVQGDGAINNIKQRTAREVIVRVEDKNKRPVGGAAVRFALPARGPGAVFSHGSRLLTVITDQNGQAKTSALKINRAVGVFKINVTASFQGHVGTAVLTQTNALAGAGATASSAGGAAGSSGAGGGGAGGGAAGSGTAAGAGTGTAAGSTAGAVGGAAGAGAAGTAGAGAAGAGAAAGGISAVTVGAIAGGAVAVGVVAGKVATSSNGSSPPPPPTATIGTPGNPEFGPGSVGSGVFAPRLSSGRIAGVTTPKSLTDWAFSASKFRRADVLGGRSLAVHTFLGRLANSQVVRFAAAHVSIHEPLGTAYKRGKTVFRIGAK